MLRAEVVAESCNVTLEHASGTLFVLREQHCHGNQFNGRKGFDTRIPSVPKCGRICVNKLVEELKDFSEMRLRLGVERVLVSGESFQRRYGMLEPRDSVRRSGIVTLVYLGEADKDVPKPRRSLVVDH